MTKTEVREKAYQLRLKYGKLCGGMYLVMHYSRDRDVTSDISIHEEWYKLFQIGPRGGIHDLGIRVDKLTSPDVRIVEEYSFYPDCLEYFCYQEDGFLDLNDPKDCALKPRFVHAAMDKIPYEFTDDAKEYRKKEEERRRKEEEKFAKINAGIERKTREHIEREERKWRECEERERREREQRRKRRNYKHREQEQKSQKHSELTQNMGELMKKAGIIS